MKIRADPRPGFSVWPIPLPIILLPGLCCVIIMPMIPDLCAVLLAGGQSRRMGFNKALLRLGGQPLIQMVLEHVRPLADEVLVSSNDQTTYEFLGLPIVPDIFKNQGPLAGLHAAMLLSARSLFLLLACDMPNLHEPLLRHLALSAEGFDAVIPRTADGVDHPLCAIYRKTCLPAIERNLRKGVNKVIGIFTESPLSVRWLKIEEDGFSDQDLANLNSPEDLEDFRIQRHAIEKIDD